ncbi:MAG: PilN domain-containing protein [Gammaproteobacteria bacterium]|jgi:type IV pilus assembly protein PilN|nr:PilN domain-containing protein [Gammaproteobacteria bacterium]
MPHINLLPWREAARQERQRQFAVVAVGAAVLAALAIVFVHLQFSGMIETQNGRNQFLEAQIKEVDKQIAEIKTLKDDKKALLARMEVIQKLQRSRPEVVHLFEEISKATPKGVFLLNTVRNGNKLNIEGVADSNDSVSAFMRQLNASPWLNNPRLTVIESNKSGYKDASWFKLDVEQVEYVEPEQQQAQVSKGKPS